MEFINTNKLLFTFTGIHTKHFLTNENAKQPTPDVFISSIGCPVSLAINALKLIRGLNSNYLHTAIVL
jgi:hypothetical protein